MEGLNEHSMQNAIQQLPQHKAGGYVWEEIRWQLEKPLSAELPLHSAPENAWKGIQASMAGYLQVKTAGVTTFAAMLLIISVILLYPFMLNETNLNTGEIIYESRGTSTQTAPDPVIQVETRIASLEPVILNNTALLNSGIPEEKTEILVQQEVVTETSNQPELFRNIFHQSELLFTMQSIDPQSIQVDLHDQHNTIQPKNDPRYDDCATFHEVNTAVFMAADYEPEFFDIKGLNSPAHSFSLSSGYRHNRLSIALGAGYKKIEGTSKLSYAYRTNELVYSYDYVDSVYVDPVTHETYYFTVKVDVYDSIDHSAEERVIDRYSYLQVPLSLNYEMAAYKKLSLHLQLFGTYHLLQENSRTYKPFYEASSRLISTTMEDEKTGSDYWSAGAGLMLAYEPINRLGISLTPRIKYNTLPVKDGSEKGFVSYGINFGIYYKIVSDR